MVGQDHITDTLRNAIRYERVSHAYLFVGTRGIGKTTIARIFAKALNCSSPSETFSPCNKCLNCQEITRGSSLDVIEIDGASNNGIEDIRSLRENTQYSPTTGKYKVYIIDEVHMLSNQAWNALLKTLEEPPKFVKFFFATTEAHKVLLTILSRCQRFDLKSISRRDIYDHLQNITQKEKVNCTTEALQVIARAANGSMRDALSILDQVIAFSCNKDGEIDQEDINAIFGLASTENLINLIFAMVANQPTEIINQVNILTSQGKNIDILYQNLLEYLRQIMIIAITPNQAAEILKIDQEEIHAILKQIEGVKTDVLQSLVNGFLENENALRHTLNKKIFFEVTLLKIVKQAHSISIDYLISQLNHLRQNESNSLINSPIIEKESKKKIANSNTEKIQEKKTHDSNIKEENNTTPSTNNEEFSIISPNLVNVTLQVDEEFIKQDPLLLNTNQTSISHKNSDIKTTKDDKTNNKNNTTQEKLIENIQTKEPQYIEDEKEVTNKNKQQNHIKKYVDEGLKVSQETLDHPISQSIFENFDGYIFHIEPKN